MLKEGITGSAVFGIPLSEIARSEEASFGLVFLAAFILFYFAINKTIFRNSGNLSVILALVIAAMVSFGILSVFGPVLALLNEQILIVVGIITIILLIIWLVIFLRKRNSTWLKVIVIGYPVAYLIYSALTSQATKASLGFVHKMLTLIFYPVLIIAIFVLISMLLGRHRRKWEATTSDRQLRREMKNQRNTAKILNRQAFGSPANFRQIQNMKKNMQKQRDYALARQSQQAINQKKAQDEHLRYLLYKQAMKKQRDEKAKILRMRRKYYRNLGGRGI